MKIEDLSKVCKELCYIGNANNETFFHLDGVRYTIKEVKPDGKLILEKMEIVKNVETKKL